MCAHAINLCHTGFGQRLFGRAIGNDIPILHPDHPGRVSRGKGNIVKDDEGAAPLVDKAADHVHHAELVAWIKGCDRFVGDE